MRIAHINVTSELSTGGIATGMFGPATAGFAVGGVTPINPYKIDDVWRVNLGTSIRFRF